MAPCVGEDSQASQSSHNPQMVKSEGPAIDARGGKPTDCSPVWGKQHFPKAATHLAYVIEGVRPRHPSLVPGPPYPTLRGFVVFDGLVAFTQGPQNRWSFG